MTVVKPNILYGIKCWKMKKCEKAKVHVFAMQMLRRVFRDHFKKKGKRKRKCLDLNRNDKVRNTCITRK